MIDLKAARAEPDAVRVALERRGAAEALDEVMDVDAEARRLRSAVETAQARRKKLSKEVGRLRSQGADSAALEDEARQIGEAISTDEEALASAEERRDTLLLDIPNLPQAEAPDGGEDDAVEMRLGGEMPQFDFPIRDHVDIGTELGIIDLERAAKVSGARFAYLMGPLVRVQMALVSYVVDRLGNAGFTPVVPPVLVREEAMWGTGFFPTDRSSIYETAADDLFLVGTSEVPLAGLHLDEIVNASDLPLRYAGISTCFRREAGAAGKDTRGIFRVHQFDKVEMFSFTSAEQSDEEHQFILAQQEAILGDLGLHWRVVDIALGDLGASAARKFDCEAWMPGQERFREVTSCSNCTDYQARRLKARMKGDSGTEMVHTLNGTAVAVGRTLIALLETHQRADGSVGVPEVLQAHGAPEQLTAE